MNVNFLDLFENDFLAIFPEIFLLNAIFILLFFGLFFETKKSNHSMLPTNHLMIDSYEVFETKSPIQSIESIDGSDTYLTDTTKPSIQGTIGWLSLWILLLTLILLYNNPIHQCILFYNSLILDDFTYIFKTLLVGSSFCAILLSISYLKQEQLNAFEFLILLLFSVLSMLLMISSYDFISFYLTIEFQSLCFYVLAASKRNSEFSTEAGLKYFILGAFSSGILLFGFSIIYGFTGMTNFGELTLLFTGIDGSKDWIGLETLVASHPNQPILSMEAIQTHDQSIGWIDGSQSDTTKPSYSSHSNGILLGILFVAVGFLFKLTAAPFHMWAPDVYEGSPTAITAFFSITPKIALLAVFSRLFLSTFYDLIFPCQKILLFCSGASMIIGALAALSQQKIKRLLAYSSIGHIGYILLGFSCATGEGIEALTIYLIIYVIMTINIFAIILSLQNRSIDGSEFAKQSKPNPFVRIKYTSDLGMLGSTNPILAFTLSCTLFSMAGIPPLAGFCSKFYIFFSALNASLYFFAFLGVLTSVISCFYYIRLIKIMYFEKPSHWIIYKPMEKEISYLLGITLFFILFFFFYPSPFFYVAHKVAISLSF
jgi:NADH:ubiquinone oxidoreductase subunit 2 (subunit N)